MKKIIFLIMMFLLIESVSAGFNYRIEGHYNNGEITLGEVSVEFSHYKPLNNFNEKYPSYIIKMNDLVENFSIILLQSTDVYDNQTGLMSGDGVKKLNEGDFFIEIPYDSNAKEIQITDLNGNVLVKKSVIEFSKNFNYKEYNANSIIENNSLDDVNNDELCKENCSEKSNVDENNNIYTIIILILLVLLLVLLSYYLIKVNRRK